MGHTTTNKVEIIRDYKPRQIIVVWHCAILGRREKVFPFESEDEAFEFAMYEFKSVSM